MFLEDYNHKAESIIAARKHIKYIEETYHIPLNEYERSLFMEASNATSDISKKTDPDEKGIDNAAMDKVKKVEKKADGTFAKIKNEVLRFYKKSDDELINNTPNLFRLVRRFVGTAAVYMGVGAFGGPALVITLLSYVSSKMLRSKMTSIQKDKLILQYKTELELINEKLKDIKGDGNDKRDRTEKYHLIKIKRKYEDILKKLKTKRVVDMS